MPYRTKQMKSMRYLNRQMENITSLMPANKLRMRKATAQRKRQKAFLAIFIQLNLTLKKPCEAYHTKSLKDNPKRDCGFLKGGV